MHSKKLYYIRSPKSAKIIRMITIDIPGYGCLEIEHFVSDFSGTLSEDGYLIHRVEGNPYLYRHLHWEAGMIGQVLYLEAEAHLLGGTGMGCFSDDSVHSLLGIPDNSFQDLYHFAVGKLVEDIRLKTLPPYSHLRERK